MIKVAQHKLKRTSRTHVHTKKATSMAATTNKQRTRLSNKQLSVNSKQYTNKPYINALMYTCISQTNTCKH